ncbi:MAG: ribose-phosphate pyrophosphokinase [Deltaproteobacteria bacterium]|nr:ribose-phosphate pyrophosphokinase [Deltaproteobacteria bacterium]
MRELKIFTGNSNKSLVRAICDSMHLPLGEAKVNTFSDGEIQVEIQENVRGADVYVIQSTCSPTNNNLMELLIMIDALKRASAARIDAVIPYFGYARQDRKAAPRTPITAKLVAELISASGAQRVLTMDLHAGQIQGFFNIPVDHIYALPVLIEELGALSGGQNLVVVSPDAGGAERARVYAKRLKAEFALIDKRRSSPNVSEVMNVIGDVQGKICILVDDMIDTAGTLCKAAEALKRKGAADVYGCATHAVLSGPALERINDSVLKQVIVTNSIPIEDKLKVCPKLKCLSVAPLLGEAIGRIHNNQSVSSLFV